MNTKQKQRKAKLGKRNPSWRGGRTKHKGTGYVTVPAPEKGSGGKREYEHRVKAKAGKGTAVHHKNKKRTDNRRSNLVATRKHRGQKGR